MRYYGNVMTTTMTQYSDDVSSVTHAGCICAPVNAITTCIYFTHRSVHILHLQQYSHRLNLLYSFFPPPLEEKLEESSDNVFSYTVLLPQLQMI